MDGNLPIDKCSKCVDFLSCSRRCRRAPFSLRRRCSRRPPVTRAERPRFFARPPSPSSAACGSVFSISSVGNLLQFQFLSATVKRYVQRTGPRHLIIAWHRPSGTTHETFANEPRCPKIPSTQETPARLTRTPSVTSIHPIACNRRRSTPASFRNRTPRLQTS